MTKMEEQPSDAQELANARYVWRKHVQTEMLGALRDPSIKLESAKWWFDRFVRAYEAEIETHTAAWPPKQKS
jgi:predicted double-glycine peptidase